MAALSLGRGARMRMGKIVVCGFALALALALCFALYFCPAIFALALYFALLLTSYKLLHWHV